MNNPTEQPHLIWWVEARRLEQLDRLAEAERVIQEAMPLYGDAWERQCAYLYELRSRRMHDEGKDTAAQEAADRSNLLMRQYVLGATSKAEGIAFSHEAAHRTKRMNEILSTSRLPQEPSGWWAEALRLERLDQLEEAEKVIEKAMRPKGDPWDCQCAHLYELRAIRLHAQGKEAAAWEAAERSDRMMRSYASGATSGGEGVALSREADRAAAELQKLLRMPPPVPGAGDRGEPAPAPK